MHTDAKKIILQISICRQQALENKKGSLAESLLLVPRAGVEPARIAPLVFETSASTDSAIWARVQHKLYA